MSKKTVTFGSYELVKRIARGGMAEVFLAVERGLEGVERQVAIKRILPHMLESDDFITMFMDEARVAARFTHPNIAHIYHFGEVAGVYFLAMEYVDGLTCAKLIRWSHGEIPLEITLRIVADVCAALDHAHGTRDAEGRLLGVIHRDVSPQNVMVSRSGVAKLLDFGVARASTQVHSTQVGKVKGKLGYIAPEVFRGDPIDHRLDIFSAGALLYELVSGQKLFRREVEAATIAAILNDRPRSLSADFAVPPALDDILFKAVAKLPEERYPTALAMQEDLEALIGKEGLVATPFRVGKFVAEQMEKISSAKEQHRARAAAEADLPSSSPGVQAPLSIHVELEDTFSALSDGRDFSAPDLSGELSSSLWSGARRSTGRVVDGARGAALAPEGSPSAPGSSRRLLVLVTAAALLAGAVAAILILAPEGERGPLADGGAVAATVHPDRTGPVDLGAPPGSAPLVEPRSPDGGATRVEAGPAEPPPAVDSAASTERAQPAEQPGRLFLHTNPWSKVRVSGRSLGTTPLINVQLPAGNHTLYLTDANGREHTKRVRIRGGTTTKLFVDLRE